MEWNQNIDQNLLSSISSTGVIVKPIDLTVPSTVDFVFVLNVRESEAYPPLFLPEDLACVEEKLAGYRSKLLTMVLHIKIDLLSKIVGFPPDDLMALEKNMLKQCLMNRIHTAVPTQPKFESQTVVTRISISCKCGNLQPGEICSKLNNIEKQKWTGFMGNNRNGLY